MALSLPTTRAGWISYGVITLVVVTVLFVGTKVFQGQAVELTVTNGAQSEIFASIDNTGRHGENTDVIRMTTTAGGTTPPGLRIPVGGLKSFGLAVGFFDSPTLHVWEITSAGLADTARVYDCAFDTINYRKLEVPSLHVKLNWTGHACQRDGSNQ